MLFLTFGAAVVSATDAVVVAQADRLTQALATLRSSPKIFNAQTQYLTAFPHDYATYMRLFDLNAPLYDGLDYVEVLSVLALSNEAAVGKLLIGLSKMRNTVQMPRLTCKVRQPNSVPNTRESSSLN